MDLDKKLSKMLEEAKKYKEDTINPVEYQELYKNGFFYSKKIKYFFDILERQKLIEKKNINDVYSYRKYHGNEFHYNKTSFGYLFNDLVLEAISEKS